MSGEPRTRVLLGLDTATAFLALAVCSAEGSVLAATSEMVARNHGARLIPALERTLAAAGVERGQVGAIACGAGPGSYTGLRVGGAAALGLARSLAVPLSGCDTLAAMAFGALVDGEEGLAALDARRGNIYVGRYRREAGKIVVLDPPRKAPREPVLREYPGLRLVEDVAPDPGHVARQAGLAVPYVPVYL